MTFSQSTKNEILKNVRSLKKCCSDVFLYAVFKTLGSLSFFGKKIALSVSTENNELLHQCADLVKKYYGVDTEIQSESTSSLRNNVVFSATFDGSLLEKFNLTCRDQDGFLLVNDEFDSGKIVSDCCKRAFAEALFVSCGSLVVPTVSGDLKESGGNSYHMEFVFSKTEIADFTLKLLHDYGFDFRKTERKNNVVLYVKDKNTVSDALVFLGATKAKLQLENLIIERELRNVANRQSNCISANIDKTVEASQRQLQAIRILEESGKMSTLSQQLKDIALFRKQNPDMSLDEIASLCGISKSGANHRLNKLIEIGSSIKGEE